MKADQVEQRPFGVEIDEEVDIALGRLIAASDGTEYAKISHAVPFRRRLESASEPAY